ncbi:MAG: hypothetical protein FWG55_01380, partial [Candidatus Bathyarchaeota archaeon]|nr:hypothetical protein [Candidatus Termiticorpusculum sp.]
ADNYVGVEYLADNYVGVEYLADNYVGVEYLPDNVLPEIKLGSEDPEDPESIKYGRYVPPRS